MNSTVQNHLSEKDEILKKIISNLTLSEIESTQNVFHDLMSCVLEQQIHYRSSKRIFQKMLSAANLEELTVRNFSVFEKLGFQNVKLSERKYETVLRIVDFFEQNSNIDWQNKTDEEVRKTLAEIKGVGTWTIDMILIYTLGRPNIFPADDYHLKLVMTRLYEIDKTAKVKAQMKAIAEEWSPYQSSGVLYLLAWKEAQKRK